MKLKIKYSSSQKFVLNLQEPKFGKLKDEIQEFIKNTYKESVRDPLVLSLNGSDPVLGSENSSLASLGIVSGDILTILPPSAIAKVPTCASISSPSSQKEKESVSSKAKEMDDNPIVPFFGAQASSSSAEIIEKVTLLEVKDGHPSAALEHLFSVCSPSSAAHAINLIVHLTMVECGFHLENDLEIPPGWKEMVATFRYYHGVYADFKCTLALVTMGEVKQVLASFPKQENSISVQVKMGEYVKDATPVIKATNIIKVAQLSRTLRDRVLYPIQIAAHQALGVPAPWHLAGLPHEVLLIIMSCLTARSVLNLGQTCQHLLSAVKDNKLWYNIYKRDFKNLFDSLNDQSHVDWKAKYKEAHKHCKEWDDLQTFFIPGMLPPRPPFGPAYPTVPPFGPPYPTVPYPEIPRPRGPDPYPPQPHPTPNPYGDPDSPYFGGDIPRPPNPFPNLPDMFDPFGQGPGRPNPSLPFMPMRPRQPRGPRFDYF